MLPTQDRIVAIDLEGDSLEPTIIHCVGFVNDESMSLFEWTDAKELLLKLIDQGFYFVIHNAKFDVAVLRKFGVDIPPGRYFCTQVLAHAINPQLPSYSLDSLTGAKLDYKQLLIQHGLWDGVGSHFNVPFNAVMGEYCVTDTKLCWQLWCDYRKHLESDDKLLSAYLNLQMPFVEVMMLMGGMYIDAQKLITTAAQIKIEIDSLTEKFYTDYPKTPALAWHKDTQQWVLKLKKKQTVSFAALSEEHLPHLQWNSPPSLSSPNDTASLLLCRGWVPDDFSDKGRPVSDQRVLARIAAVESNPQPLKDVAIRIQAIKSLTGILTQLVSIAQLLCERDTQLLKADWHQTGTKTGRLSSSNPNLQNISTRHPKWGKVVRSCFTAPPGHAMLVGDLAQIELAILAYHLEDILSDSTMAEAARQKQDFHTANAINWLGADPTAPDFKGKRSIVKNGIFAANYGAAALRLALTINVSVSEAQEILNTVKHNSEIESLKHVFWEALASQRNVRRVWGEKRGFFYDCMGVRHFYPDIVSNDSYKKSTAKRGSFNCLMQGGCSSIMMHFLNQLVPILKSTNGWFAGLVHDEALLVVPNEHKEYVLSEANRIFSSLTLQTDKGGVPVRAEFNQVNDWSEK